MHRIVKKISQTIKNMLILKISDSGFLDPYCDYGQQVIISPDKAVTFPIGCKSKRDYKNKIRKSIYFILREGILNTYHKVRCALEDEAIEREKKIILAARALPNTNNILIGIGVNFSDKLNKFLFHRSLCGTVEDDNLDEVISTVVLKLEKDNNSFLEKLSYYSIYSGEEPKVKLIDIIPDIIPIENNNFQTHKNNQIRVKEREENYECDLFLFGAGNYPRSYILPICRGINLAGVADFNPMLIKYIEKRYNFKYLTTDYHKLYEKIESSNKPVCIIATYHDTHTEIAEKCYDYNKEAIIFIEKPPVVTFDDLKTLAELYKKSNIEIGYNRRYIPFNKLIKGYLSQIDSPKFLNFSIKELQINRNHWYYWKKEGTRITGNLCHWIDLATYFIDELPSEIVMISNRDKKRDDLSVSIKYEGGSLANLMVSEAGNALRGVQERLEIRSGNLTIKSDDYLKNEILYNGSKKKRSRIRRDKGHNRMYKDFFRRVGDADFAPIYPFKDLIISSYLMIKIANMFENDIKQYSINEKEILEFLS